MKHTQHRRREQQIRENLEQVAKEVIGYFWQITEDKHGMHNGEDYRIAIVGGLAVMNYVTQNRTTEDIDFIITTPGAPESVKSKLIRLSDRFREEAWKLSYVDNQGKTTYIDFLSCHEFPYIPQAATPIGQVVMSGKLPYVSVKDLVAFKTFSCGMRSNTKLNRIDARDVICLLGLLDKSAAWTIEQWQVIAAGWHNLIEFSGKNERWWKAKLKLAEA